jgi:hypothetical protein
MEIAASSARPAYLQARIEGLTRYCDFYGIRQLASPRVQPVAKIVQYGLILLPLMAWLAALDDFRNWLIREAA